MSIDNDLLTLPPDGANSLSVRASALIAADPATRRVMDLVARIAPSDATILVIGETGTGKEIIARHLHALSSRASGPFAAVNCGAFAESLVESELFGHEAGAFTGAQGARAGWFEAAHRGTLFLDEIGDLPLTTQVKLLRVLQEREVVRVGSRKPLRIDVRLVAATNVDLEAAVASGRFRADLFYRIKVITAHLPPLRERRGDILPLADHFLTRYSRRLSVRRQFSDGAEEALLAYPWPGNIRELENVIHRSVLVARNEEIQVEDLVLPTLAVPVPVAPASSTEPSALGHAGAQQAREATLGASLDEEFRTVLDRLFEGDRQDLLDWITDQVVRRAYAHGGGSQVQAAKLLGISRNVFRTLMKRGGLLIGDGRVGRVIPDVHQELISG
jgi:sigma-54-specific transcriptional regulator